MTATTTAPHTTAGDTTEPLVHTGRERYYRLDASLEVGFGAQVLYNEICNQIGSRPFRKTELDLSVVNMGEHAYTTAMRELVRARVVIYRRFHGYQLTRGRGLPRPGTPPTGVNARTRVNNYSPEGGVVEDTHHENSPETAASPHATAAPSHRSGSETAGQGGVVHTGENAGEKPKGTRRFSRRGPGAAYVAAGRQVVAGVTNPAVRAKPKHAASIGYTLRMMVEDHGLELGKAVAILVTWGNTHQSVAKADVAARLAAGVVPTVMITGEQAAAAEAQLSTADPAGASVPAPVDVVDRPTPPATPAPAAERLAKLEALKAAYPPVSTAAAAAHAAAALAVSLRPAMGFGARSFEDWRDHLDAVEATPAEAMAAVRAVHERGYPGPITAGEVQDAVEYARPRVLEDVSGS